MQITAACHVHSTWSYDGRWTLRELADEFSARGYRLLLMTEHDRGFTGDRLARYREACAAATTKSILVIPGLEYSDASNLVHILAWGDMPFWGEGLPTAALLSAVQAANGVAVLAHPARRNAWKCYAPEWTEHLLGVEVWNRKTDGWAPSRLGTGFTGHPNLVPFVGMDFHDARQMFPLAMELECDGKLNEASVLRSLRHRQCRATAFGQPLERASRGWFGGILRAGECCRRTAARAAGFWRKARRGSPALNGATG